MLTHLSGPRGTLGVRDGRRTRPRRSRTPCHSPCGHTFWSCFYACWEQVSVCGSYSHLSHLTSPKFGGVGIFWKYVNAGRIQPYSWAVCCSPLTAFHEKSRSIMHCTCFPDSSQYFTITMFRATSRLLECRITFFTRSPCGLCDTAKAVVEKVRAQRPLVYHEINVMDPGQERWKELYEFDTPVVRFAAQICLLRTSN